MRTRRKGGLQRQLRESGQPLETDLALADSEHLSPTDGAHSLGRRPAVFHCNGLAILHFFLGLTFHAVCLHQFHLLLVTNDRPFALPCQWLRTTHTRLRYIDMTAILTLTCPPITEPALVLDWRIRKRGQSNGEEGIQTRGDHQQAARG